MTVTILSAVTGTFTLSGGIKWLQREIHSHEELDRIQEHDSSIIYFGYFQESVWEMLRLLTDDDDTLNWVVADDGGNVYDVDIRATAEDIELAFIFKLYMVLPVYFSPADRRKYIIVHENGQNQNYYLYPKR